MSLLQLITGGEGLVLISGKPHSGLDSNRSNILLTEAAAGDETYHIQLEVYCKAINVWASPTLETKNTRNKIVGIHIIGTGSLDQLYIEPRDSSCFKKWCQKFELRRVKFENWTRKTFDCQLR